MPIENTVPRELQENFNSIIEKLIENYRPTRNYYKDRSSDSGVYIKSINSDKNDYFSFHPTIEKYSKIMHNRIHLKILNKDSKDTIIDLKINEDDLLVPKESSKYIFSNITDTDILNEYYNLQKFIKDEISNTGIRTIDPEPQPPPFNLDSGIFPSLSKPNNKFKNKYLQYKLKYLILKVYKNN